MTKELTDDQIRPLIPQDMDWKYVVGEAGALEFAREVIKLDRANREKNYTMLTSYAKQYHAETAEEMYARHVDAEEADDETIRKMLAVTKPALYGKHLRGPNDGPITRATIEAEIAIAKQQFAIVAEALMQAESAQPECEINTVTATAPREIWLRVRNDAAHCDKPFPDVHGTMVTWGRESIMACEVHYIRSDVVGVSQPERKPMTLDQVDDLAEDGVFLRSVYEIVQAVEAFHGIKDAP